MIGRAVTTINADNVVVFDVVGQQTPHTAKRANRVDFLVDGLAANLRLGHQRTRGAGLHTLSAGHARAVAHVVVQVEDDLAVGSAQGVTDDVVDLLLTAGAHAAVALNACIQVHGDGRMRNVRFGLLTTQGFEPGAHGNVQACGPVA